MRTLTHMPTKWWTLSLTFRHDDDEKTEYRELYVDLFLIFLHNVCRTVCVWLRSLCVCGADSPFFFKLLSLAVVQYRFCLFALPLLPPAVRAHLINLYSVFAMIINGSKWGCWKNLERLRALKVNALTALQWFCAKNKVFSFFFLCSASLWFMR